MTVWTALLTIGAIILLYIIVLQEIGRRESDYDRGWSHHESLMKLYEMTPDDEALLKELKTAVKMYIKQSGLYRSGDVKNIEAATDFKEFKDAAWNVTVKRKEQEGANDEYDK